MLSVLRVNLPLSMDSENCQAFFTKYGDCDTQLINDYDPKYSGISCIVKYKHFSSVQQLLFSPLKIENNAIKCTLKYKDNDRFDEQTEYPYYLQYPEYYYHFWYACHDVVVTSQKQDSNVQALEE